MFEIERVEADLQKVVAGLDAACLEGRDAARLTESAARIERLGATAKMLLAQRAAETNAWRHRSHAATSDQWLAEVSGSTEGSAREVFATATRLTGLPVTAEKLRAGGRSANDTSAPGRKASRPAVRSPVPPKPSRRSSTARPHPAAPARSPASGLSRSPTPARC